MPDSATAERIERAEDLDLPPETVRVFKHLSSHGRAVFSQEIVGALVEAQHSNDLRPVKDVIEAWTRTLILHHQPGYKQAVKWARTTHSTRVMTAEQIAERYTSKR